MLSLFNSICLQNDDATEKLIAVRQLTIKTLKSKSWFVEVKKIFWRYDLGDVHEHLRTPPSKQQWKGRVNKVVDNYWTDRIVAMIPYHKSLIYLNTRNIRLGNPHPLLKISNSTARTLHRIPVQMKLVTGTYILQSTRASFNQNQVDPTCRVCKTAPETIQHFVLECPVLQEVRAPIIPLIADELQGVVGTLDWHTVSIADKLRYIFDVTNIYGTTILSKEQLQMVEKLDFHAKRLMFTLHDHRHKYLQASVTQQGLSKYI